MHVKSKLHLFLGFLIPVLAVFGSVIFLGLTSIAPKPDVPNIKQAKNDSLQHDLNLYQQSRKTLNATERSYRNTARDAEMVNHSLDSLNHLTDSLKTLKSRIYGKSVHKAKVTVNAEDARLVKTYDSVIQVNANASKQLAKLLSRTQKDLGQWTQSYEEAKQNLAKVISNIQMHAAMLEGSQVVYFREMSYQFFVVNTDSQLIQTHLFVPHSKNQKYLTLGALQQWLQAHQQDPLMLTNAGMYTPEFNPKGLLVSAYKQDYFPLDTGKSEPNANFYLKPNGVFYVDAQGFAHIDTTEVLNHKEPGFWKTVSAATQSGPMLIIHDRIHPAFTPGSKNHKIRSGVGILPGPAHKVVFVITRDESNFYDFATFFKDVFGCHDALFLDGAISQMYVPGLSEQDLGGNFGPMISVVKKATGAKH